MKFLPSFVLLSLLQTLSEAPKLFRSSSSIPFLRRGSTQSLYTKASDPRLSVTSEAPQRGSKYISGYMGSQMDLEQYIARNRDSSTSSRDSSEYEQLQRENSPYVPIYTQILPVHESFYNFDTMDDLSRKVAEQRKRGVVSQFEYRPGMVESGQLGVEPTQHVPEISRLQNTSPNVTPQESVRQKKKISRLDRLIKLFGLKASLKKPRPRAPAKVPPPTIAKQVSYKGIKRALENIATNANLNINERDMLYFYECSLDYILQYGAPIDIKLLQSFCCPLLIEVKQNLCNPYTSVIASLDGEEINQLRLLSRKKMVL